MPKRSDLESILILGAGPIIIGQACEFDYSGAQACKALREEGYRVILVNSNPATIMTDPTMADATYIEPIRWETVEKIIEKERPEKPDLLSLGFKKSSVDHLFAILSLSGKRPLNFNIERLSSRIMKREIGIRNTVNRQIAISLFIGEDGDGKVYRASSEYAKTICQNNDPSCLVCVIQKECTFFNSI